MERLLTAAVALVLLLAACSTQRASGRSDQWCVNRWNQLDMSYGRSFAIAAIVSGQPGCSVTLANMSVPTGRPCRRAPGFRLCIGRDVFECNLNRYGAYSCPSHANHTAPTDVRRWNAAIRHGRLVLDPCFPQRSPWRRGGVLAACPELEGSTTFARFAILGPA